jgi:hypothetical protein
MNTVDALRGVSIREFVRRGYGMGGYRLRRRVGRLYD